jgi:hypothetical protein
VPVARRYPDTAPGFGHLKEQFKCLGAADETFCIAIGKHVMSVVGLQPPFDCEIDCWPIIAYEGP